MSFLLSLRRLCVLRFTPTHLILISSAVQEPQIWCKVNKDVFATYEVESTRENIIALEINIAPLFQVLKHYERAKSTSNLSLRLQRKATNESGVSKNKAIASLSLFYTEQISLNSDISHSFNIPVRLLKMENDQRIVEPGLSDVDIIMKFPPQIGNIFKRIERYKTSDTIVVSANKLGFLKFIIEEDQRKITIGWKEKLQIQETDEGFDNLPEEELLRPVNLRIKLKYWNLVAKVTEISSEVVLILCGNEVGVTHSYLDTDENYEIVYYTNGIHNYEL